MLLVFGHNTDRQLACYLAAGNHETIIQAGSRAPSIPVPLAVAATTRQIQTGPSAIPGSITWQVKLSSATGFSLGLFQRALCPLGPLMCPLGLAQTNNVPFGYTSKPTYF